MYYFFCRFNEDCKYSHCGYREHQTHFHCMRSDCGYSFCDKTRFVQHTARHERLDTLMGGDFQQFRSNVACGRPECVYTTTLGKCVTFSFVLLDSLHYARTFHLLEFLSEAFRCYVHHLQCLMVPVVTVNGPGGDS